MKRFKVKLSLIAMMLIVAVAACGMSLFAFAEVEPTVDAGGFYTQVKRGGEFVNSVEHEYTEDGFSKYTGTQTNDKIVLNGTFPVIKRDASRAYTNSFRLDINAVGDSTGQVSWKFINSEDSSIEIGGGITIGGTFDAKPARYTQAVTNDYVVQSGKTVSTIVNGFHTMGSNIYFIKDDGKLVRVGTTTNTKNGLSDTDAGADPLMTMNWDTWGVDPNYNPNFKLEITLYGNVTACSVKLGTSVDVEWDKATGIEYESIMYGNDDNNDLANGLYCTNSSTNHPMEVAFQGFENTFVLKKFNASEYAAGADSTRPHVSLGGTRVDFDGTSKLAYADHFIYGNYHFVAPRNADKVTLAVVNAEHTVTYVNPLNDAVLFKSYLNKGESAYEPESMSVPGATVIGWLAEKGGADYDFTTAVNSDITLYAKLEMAVVANFYDGTNLLSYENYKTGDTITKISDPTKAGHVFKGWYSDAELTTPFDFTTPIRVGVEEVNIYAAWQVNINYKVLGYNATYSNPDDQTQIVSVDSGTKITAADLPTFAQMTGWPAFTNIELTWYTDRGMTNLLTFGTDGIVIDNTVTYYAAISDKSEAVAQSYVNYNLADGWDLNTKQVAKDDDDNILTDNVSMRGGNVHGINYGSLTAIKSEDGYASMELNTVGYLVNGRKFDADKPIYVSYTLDGSPDPQATDGEKWFMLGVFNSLTGALISQGQLHEGNYGALGGIQHHVSGSNLEFGALPGVAPKHNGWGGYEGTHTPAADYFLYEENKMIELMFTFGDVPGFWLTNDAQNLWIACKDANGDWQVVSNQSALTKNMFENGVYLAIETTRDTKIKIKATQESTVSVAADAQDVVTLETFEAGTVLMAGDKIRFNVNVPEGYTFSKNGLYANGKAVTVLDTEDDNDYAYYFNLPYGASELTVGLGVNIIFMADGVKVDEIAAVIGQAFDIFDAPDAPAKEGYERNVEWYTDSALTVKYNFDTVISDTVTLYAKYTPRTYNLTLLDGGNILGTVKGTFGEKFAAPADPAKEGHVFKGWYTDADCTTEFNFETTTVSGNAMAYAKFEAVESKPDDTTKPNDTDKDNNTDKDDNTTQPAETKKKKCGGVATASSVIGASIALILAAGVVLIKRKEQKA